MQPNVSKQLNRRCTAETFPRLNKVEEFESNKGYLTFSEERNPGLEISHK
jgi:hypothetical protein